MHGAGYYAPFFQAYAMLPNALNSMLSSALDCMLPDSARSKIQNWPPLENGSWIESVTILIRPQLMELMVNIPLIKTLV